MKRYKTSPGWYEINDVTEYNGASVRLKPSYTSSTEFKADLEDKQKEVSKDIFRQRDNMSDAKSEVKVKRWNLSQLDRLSSNSWGNPTFVSARDHDRIMAERDELWERATKFVMPGEMDTGESIEHYIKTLEQTIATQVRVIEKLKATVDGTILYVNLAGAEYLREQSKELEAIEQGEGT